jgi:hypothetical protein
MKEMLEASHQESGVDGHSSTDPITVIAAQKGSMIASQKAMFNLMEGEEEDGPSTLLENQEKSLSKENPEKSWIEMLSEEPIWLRPKEDLEAKRTEETGSSLAHPKCQWRLVQERIIRRKSQGQREFQQRRKRKISEGEQQESSPFAQAFELPDWLHKRCLFGWEPPPDLGTRNWEIQKAKEWRAQALDLFVLRARLKFSEKFWQDEERNRKDRCEYFGRPFVSKPWPGGEQKESPGNQRTIQKMLAVNPVFRGQYFKKALEDWLHPETKEVRKQQREEWRQRAWAKAREDWATRHVVELMAQVTG